MMRRIVHSLRRVVGTENTVHALVTHANHQTDDLIRHGNHVLADLKEYVDARLAELQRDLARQVTDDLIHTRDSVLASLTERIDARLASLQQDLTRRVADELGQNGSSALSDLAAHVDARISALREDLPQRAAEPQACAAARPPSAAEPVQPPLPGDLKILDLLSRRACSMEEPPLDSLGELETLSRKGLFVVGNARSGTTILQQCLNLSKEIHLLDESNLYMNHSKPGFTSWFNAMHEGTKNLAGKGTFVPEPPVALHGGIAYLAWLARHYRYVGEKHAFGPHGLLDGVPLQNAFRAFNGRFFYHSTYFNVIRTPAECVWSMHKMFPDASLESLVESWLRSIYLCADLYAAFPNCYMIFFEDLNAGTIARTSEILQTEIRLPPKMVSDASKLSRLPLGELPEVLWGLAELLERCHAVYDRLRAMFSPDTLLAKDMEGSIWHWLKVLRVQILEMLESLPMEAAPPLRRAAG